MRSHGRLGTDDEVQTTAMEQAPKLEQQGERGVGTGRWVMSEALMEERALELGLDSWAGH